MGGWQRSPVPTDGRTRRAVQSLDGCCSDRSRVTAKTPRAPRVTTTSAGPRACHSRATSSSRRPGWSQRRSSSLTLTMSDSPTMCSTPARARSGVPRSSGRPFGRDWSWHRGRTLRRRGRRWPTGARRSSRRRSPHPVGSPTRRCLPAARAEGDVRRAATRMSDERAAPPLPDQVDQRLTDHDEHCVSSPGCPRRSTGRGPSGSPAWPEHHARTERPASWSTRR
jgi:hypothetical protein